ncbi:LOW QUALITY PROTEIN: hypothetical protein Cgig2_017299 [Carnegiea gigantea]|uniref:Uncharacterized protein n=1 Tax=Carnegiea gigantea TaxID=171969 RepID=A0A9Q1QIH3_9CARY|nr:LOW QUALITY PROTEIN: hypothetical protein Cgig2_017299 [Carnegiea gigantea]
MEDGEESMRAANANEPENAVNDNRRRKSVVTITYKRKSKTLVSEAEGERQGKAHNQESEPHNNDDQMSQSTEYTIPPEPEPASKKQRKQHHRDSLQPTTKRAPKTTTKRKSNSGILKLKNLANTGLSVIKTRSWTGLLRHRMAPGGFLTLVERLDYEQWSAIIHTGNAVGENEINSKKMARWLLEKHNPWDNSLNLTNGKLLVDEEDVYATLGLPMGEHEIIEGHSSEAEIEFLELWRRR